MAAHVVIHTMINGLHDNNFNSISLKSKWIKKSGKITQSSSITGKAC